MQPVFRRGWPPLAAFLIQRALLAICAASAGQDPFRLDSYARWDSAFYLDIAARGYVTPAHCTPDTGYPAWAWCGNSAWFPGYSWAIWLFAHLRVSPLAAAFVVTAIAQLVCLVAVSEWTRHEATAISRYAPLALAAFFPGNVYLATIFPTAPFVLLALICLRCCSFGRPLRGAAAGCGAATCHPLGALLAFVTALPCLYRRRRAWMVPAGVLLGTGSCTWCCASRPEARMPFPAFKPNTVMTCSAASTVGSRG
ncbi:MAG TPA: hypothetical protein VGH20_05310 [Myxococcales bacterium]|jgi:hypothetical protein